MYKLNFFKIIFISVTIFFSYLNIYFLILLLILIIVNKKYINFFIFSTILSLLLILNFEHHERKVYDLVNETELIAIVNYAYDDKIVIVYKNEKILVSIDNDLKPGNIVLFKGNILIPNESLNENQFNYRLYLKSKKINYVSYENEVQLIDTTFHINIIRFNFLNNIKNDYSNKTLIYIESLLFGESFEGDVEKDINELGISHLFSISGLHIGIFIIIIKYFSTNLLKIKKTEYIIIIFLIIYIIITNFGVSIIRSSLMYYLYILNKKISLNLLSIDIISIVFIIFIFYNPYIIYNIGFIYSFIITFFLLLSKKIFKNKTKIINIFLVNFIASLTSIGITLYFSYIINPFNIITNMIFSIFFTTIFLPSTILVFLIPQFDPIYISLINFFEILIIFFNDSNLTINVPKPSILMIIIYYIILYILFLSIELNKNVLTPLTSLIIFLFICFNINIINKNGELHLLSIDNSEFIYIRYPHNSCNIIIDIGETYYKTNYNYTIKPFLLSKGVSSIDYVFITHAHYDHYGGLSNLILDFDVKTIAISKFDKINLYKNTVTFESGDRITCGGNNIDVLYPNIIEHSNINNNSLVLHTKLGDQNFLFTGDIEEEAENNIIKLYPKLTVDVLKVAHHGSNTSTNQLFLNSYLPSSALILVGNNNKYNHPSIEVINRLNNNEIKIYRTDIHGGIKYIFNNNSYSFSTIK